MYFIMLSQWVTRWVSTKKQELLTLREHRGFSGIRVAQLFLVFCVALFVFFILIEFVLHLCLVLPKWLDCRFLLPLLISVTLLYSNIVGSRYVGTYVFGPVGIIWKIICIKNKRQHRIDSSDCGHVVIIHWII